MGAGHGARMLNVARWILALFVAVLIIGPPLVAYRYQYIHAKRFREVTPGRFYRSGQMTADGFRDAIERYRIKTVINLQHEDPDPLLPDHWLGKGKVRESELCRRTRGEVRPHQARRPSDRTTGSTCCRPRSTST